MNKNILLVVILTLIIASIAFATLNTDPIIPQTFTVQINSSGGSGGAPPYTYQWFSECPSCGSFTSMTGQTNVDLFFKTNTITPTGTWQFLLQTTDTTPTIANSVSVNVVVVNALTFNSYGVIYTGGTGIAISSSNVITNIGVTGIQGSSGTYNSAFNGIVTLYSPLYTPNNGISISSTNAVSVNVVPNRPITFNKTALYFNFNGAGMGIDSFNGLYDNPEVFGSVTATYPLVLSPTNVLSIVPNGIFNFNSPLTMLGTYNTISDIATSNTYVPASLYAKPDYINWNVILILLMGVLFMIMYIRENQKEETRRDNILRFVYLMVGITLLTVSVLNNYALSSSTSFVNGTTTYSYTPDANIYWIATPLEYFSVGLIIIFLYRAIQKMREGKPI